MLQSASQDVSFPGRDNDKALPYGPGWRHVQREFINIWNESAPIFNALNFWQIRVNKKNHPDNNLSWIQTDLSWGRPCTFTHGPINHPIFVALWVNGVEIDPQSYRIIYAPDFSLRLVLKGLEKLSQHRWASKQSGHLTRWFIRCLL